jgi:uncharacterized protein (TIGR02466 family)
MTSFEIIPLFPQALYRSVFRPLTDEEIRIIDNVPVSRQQLGNHTSHDPYFLNEPGLEDLKRDLQVHIENYVQEVMKVNYEVYITNSWKNVTKPGEQHMIHNHTNSILSGCLYIRSSYIQPTISFTRGSCPYLLAFESEEFTPFNSLEWTIPVEDNNIIIFPSTMHHYVKPNTSNKDRLSLAFNTFVRGNIRTQNTGADLILK